MKMTINASLHQDPSISTFTLLSSEMSGIPPGTEDLAGSDFLLQEDSANSSLCSETNPLSFLECTRDNTELAGVLLKAFALGLIILFTVFGNVLVLISVAVSRNLRSSTHYLIVNLAVADLLLGTTVLPFSAVFEVTGKWWFGLVWCQGWAALDVLCCTSSILSLCVISLDRYIGVTRPLAYSAIMVGRRTSILIVLIWASSLAISIGPLFGWKEPPSNDPYHCAVNKQIGYVLFSSTGSFYLPMLVIIFVYWKIYKVAIRETKFLECGHKTMKHDITLRIHLGGYLGRMNDRRPPKGHRPCPSASISVAGSDEGSLSMPALPGPEINNIALPNLLALAPLAKPEKSSSSSFNEEHQHQQHHHVGDDPLVLRIHRGGSTWPNGTSASPATNHGNLRLTKKSGNGHKRGKGKKNGSADVKKHQHSQMGNEEHHRYHHNHHRGHHNLNGHNGNRANSLTPSPPSSSPERKLNAGFGKIAKFRRQKKTAKTLAIVVGVFLVCWFPFFFVLPLGALCEQCNIPEWMFNLFFWLGYFNSCLNPIIYGCTSREFQRAFRRILCRHSPPRPHISRAIYRANMCNNNRFGVERPSGGNNNGIPLHHWP